MKKLFSFLLVLCLLAALSACAENDGTVTDTESTETEISYDDINVYEYVSEVKYKDLSVELTGDNAIDAQALWSAVYSSAKISAYPEDKVLYYFDQAKKSYMHSVGYNEEDYELLLENKGIDESDMLEDAKRMVCEDMVFEYIVKKESISLTDGEMSENFNKYVAELSERFGVNEEYMRTEMADYVYDTMLYDKVTEFLIVQNK